MRLFAALLALGLLLSGPRVSAEPAAPEGPAETSTMVPEFLVLAQAGVDGSRSSRRPTNAQIRGISVSIVAGVLVADLTGLNGLATQTLAATCGAAANMCSLRIMR